MNKEDQQKAKALFYDAAGKNSIARQSLANYDALRTIDSFTPIL